jgi:hypothetical protein
MKFLINLLLLITMIFAASVIGPASDKVQYRQPTTMAIDAIELKTL